MVSVSSGTDQDNEDRHDKHVSVYSDECVLDHVLQEPTLEMHGKTSGM